ncbi:hypothetical protein, partial [Acidiphilium sp. PM]|uniref:hypothetical protein n=1 Tax=Acidiphilium sp. PM TaxID=1043206 RepID=UPI0002144D44
PDAREGRSEQAQKALEAAQKAEEARRAAEAAQKAAEAAQEAVERQQAADEADRTRWRSMPLNALQWEVETLRPDRDAALAAARMADPAYRKAEEAAETARAGEAKARVNLLEATETERSLKQRAERYRENQGLLGRVRFWLQDKGVLEIPEWKRLQDQISDTQAMVAQRKSDLASAEELNATAKIAFSKLYSATAVAVDEILAPEFRRYEAAQSVLDERVDEDRRRAAEAEAERGEQERMRALEARIEREIAEMGEWKAEVRDGVVTLRLIPPGGNDETKEVTKDKPQEREAQANREKDRGFDMMD